MRGRSRKGPNPLSRTFESNGPDVKIRGTASHIADKYVQLARDAQSSGDPVAAENYFQHAEHYYRILAAAQPQFQPQQGFSRADDDRDEDGEEGDFEGDGAPGFNGAQEPPFAAQQPRPYEGDRPRPEGGNPRYDSRQRSDEHGNRDQGQGQPRYPRDDHGHGGQQRQNPRYDDNRRQPYDNRGGNNNYRGDGNTYRGGGQPRDGEQRPRYDDRRPGGDRPPQHSQGDRDRGYGDRQSQGERQRPAENRGEAPRPEIRAAAEQPRIDQPRVEAPRAEPPRSFDREPDPGLPAFITGPSPIVAANGHDTAPEPAAEPAPRAPARRRRPYKARGADGAAEAAAAAATPEAAVSGPAEE